MTFSSWLPIDVGESLGVEVRKCFYLCLVVPESQSSDHDKNKKEKIKFA